MRYVRKPIQIEAVLWNGFDGVYEVVEEMVSPQPVDRLAEDALAIHTLSGTKVANIGDYVCRDVNDQSIFVVNGTGFKHMYDPIEEEEE